MKTLLVTGFEPFPKYRVNSSWESVRDLEGVTQDEWTLRARLLPVSYERAAPLLARHLAELQPQAAVSFGLSPTLTIRLERIAVNFNHLDKKADNDGKKPQDERIVPGGPVGLESTLPVQAIFTRLRERRIPAMLSFHAGTYLCNNIFYVLRSSAPNIPAGFVHVPPIGWFWGWRLDRIKAAVREIVDVVIHESKTGVSS